MIKREAAQRGAWGETPAWFSIQVKDATDFRRWPYRADLVRYATRKDAERAATELHGLHLVKRWCDVELTKEEQGTQYDR